MLNRHYLVLIAAGCVGLCCLDKPLKRYRSEYNADSIATQRLVGEPLPLPNSQRLRALPRRFDADVVPASATSVVTGAVLSSLAAINAVDDTSITITELQQGKLVWPISNRVRRVLLASADGVTVNGKSKNIDLTKYNIGVRVHYAEREPLLPVYTNPQTIADWSVEVKLSSDVTQLELVKKLAEAERGDFESVGTPINIVPPSTDVAAPRMRSLRNNSRISIPTHNFNDDGSDLAGVRVYGGYLRLIAERVSPDTRLDFLVFKQEEAKERYVLLDWETPTGDVRRPEATDWEGMLALPVPPEMQRLQSGMLVVRASKPSENAHAFGINKLGFIIDSKPDSLTAPTFSAQALTYASSGVVNKIGGVYYSNKSTVNISGDIGQNSASPADGRIAILLGSGDTLLASPNLNSDKRTWTAQVELPERRDNQLRVAWSLGDKLYEASQPIVVHVRTTGPKIVSVEPVNFVSTPNLHNVTVTFDEELNDLSSPDYLKFKLQPATTGVPIAFAQGAKLSDDKKSVIIQYTAFSPDELKFTVAANAVTDLFGNALEVQAPVVLVKPLGGDMPTISRGITGATGENVSFGEYTKPRPFIEGFNPSDHVETRVSRLYYFRDAHRVAQIINRDAKSFNRAAVDMEQQLADKSRTVADQATDERRAKEREAVRAAEATREAEGELQRAETNAQRAAAEAANANDQIRQLNDILNDPTRALTESDRAQLNREIGQATDARTSLEQVFEAERRRAAAAADKVQAMRAAEAGASERWQSSIAVEDRAREEQFRREVAAAHTDPDTYAAGKPGSDDPVRQVSVSVIGEGLIHLRGPIKGINIIRTMINQIDAPVGQVRVGVHTVQINGEKGDRMEVVASKVQRFVDHSRFLTLQSAEMLRKSIVQVAAQRAIECGNVPGLSQADRDRSYLYSFFGQDFIRELEIMDSEFLATGNKLLSIHSMDSTSLASALFIMALAKNSTRIQILQTFEAKMAGELPRAEQNYFEAGLTCDGKHKLFDKHCQRNEFTLLSQNARFQSIRGMFDVEIAEDDTMTPMQREFLKLAQIFKSQLVVEMELKQRVMERSVIEERVGDRAKELADALKKETDANKARQSSQNALRQAQNDAIAASRRLLSELSSANATVVETIKGIQGTEEVLNELPPVASRSGPVPAEETNGDGRDVGPPQATILEQQRNADVDRRLKELAAAAAKINADLGNSQVDSQAPAVPDEVLPRGVEPRDLQNGAELTRVKQNQAANLLDNFQRARAIAERKVDELTSVTDELARITAALASTDPDIPQLYQCWLNVEQALASELANSKSAESKAAMELGRKSFQVLLEKNLDYDYAVGRAEASRRPLDHKKFLDMLVDEMEDKYIELLEGTRAHTANMDAYIKRLMTALDDDFNTQFYFPTFRKVREASQMWDVQLGQVETTSVLANNRAFAKVSPQATMEFDLPKRDILISEGMNGAKAVIDDIGALAQDPTFLALAQMKSGSPTSTPMGGTNGGQATVRNVLPGLSTDTAESVMGQQGPGGSRFGSAMEALIPDPAIYKFETGTGWEIRPVIQPDGQALVFHFNYMYTTNVREPVRADEKHLGRVKRHFVDTDVQLSNFELREISRYTVALKTSRTSRGVPLLEDAPVVGALFRPLPSDESSLQQNVILGQATIFPTVFDLMGLRWAPVVADLDPLRLSNDEFIVRNRHRAITNRVFDEASSEVDKFLRIPEADRRMDLYRSQETIPSVHPNGYDGPGANLRDIQLQEGYDPTRRQESQFIPGSSIEGSLELQDRRRRTELQNEVPLMQPRAGQPSSWDNSSLRNSTRAPVVVASAAYQRQSGEANPQPRNTAIPPAGTPLSATRPVNPPAAKTKQTWLQRWR